MSIVVLKFGGTSVSTRPRWETIGRIAAARQQEGQGAAHDAGAADADVIGRCHRGIVGAGHNAGRSYFPGNPTP